MRGGDSWRHRPRVSAQQKEMIIGLLGKGKNTLQISTETGIELEKVNRVAEKMYDPRTEEDEGITL